MTNTITKVGFSTLVLISVLFVGIGVAMAATFTSFTQSELDTNWEADRTFPTGGVASVSAYGRDDVVHFPLIVITRIQNPFIVQKVLQQLVHRILVQL